MSVAMQGVSGATRILVPFEPSGRFEILNVFASGPHILTEQLSAANGTTTTVPFVMHTLSVKLPSAVRKGSLSGITSSCVACHSQFEWFVSHLSGIRTDRGISFTGA